jgi:catechol 2,3-dioxygenase-like lactoylglutathione lyase family enzyme
MVPQPLEIRLASGIYALNRLLMTLQNKRVPVAAFSISGGSKETRLSILLDCPEETARRYATLLEGLEDVEEIEVRAPEGEGLSEVPVRVERLDHLVLTVRDVEETSAFYERVLGLRGVEFGGGRRALAFGEQKINLHEAGREFEPKAARPTPGSADLCFVVEREIPAVVEHLKSEGVEVVEGPVERTGAVGRMTSVYLRDPDGNLIEMSKYEEA